MILEHFHRMGTGSKKCVKDLCDRLGQFVVKFFNYTKIWFYQRS